MRPRTSFVSAFAAVLLALAASSCHGDSPGYETLETRVVTLPDLYQERAEVKITPEEMAKGMMYRDSIAAGEGMLFVHQQAGLNPYWMGHCNVALDIIWMNSDHRVVEISSATPPCPSGDPTVCPSYGGHFTSQYVLEIASGEAAKHRVAEGSTLKF